MIQGGAVCVLQWKLRKSVYAFALFYHHLRYRRDDSLQCRLLLCNLYVQTQQLVRWSNSELIASMASAECSQE